MKWFEKTEAVDLYFWNLHQSILGVADPTHRCYAKKPTPP